MKCSQLKPNFSRTKNAFTAADKISATRATDLSALSYARSLWPL
jgi:hypothetical protein